MEQEPELLKGNQCFAIIHKDTGRLLDSKDGSYPHEYMVRDCLGDGATEEQVIRVIVHQNLSGLRVWELRYDVDNYLRANRFLSEETWAGIMQFGAQNLIRLGANSAEAAACDDRLLTKTTTLEKLALGVVP